MPRRLWGSSGHLHLLLSHLHWLQTGLPADLCQGQSIKSLELLCVQVFSQPLGTTRTPVFEGDTVAYNHSQVW